MCRSVPAGSTTVERAAGACKLRHARHRIRARNRLPEAKRQRDILVRPARKGFVDKKVARDLAQHAEHHFVAYPLSAQTLHHAQARPLRRHANAAVLPGHGSSHSCTACSCE